MRDGTAYVGFGIYTLAEAARLSGVSPQRIRRWLVGYKYSHLEEVRSQPPVFRGQIEPFGSKLELGFRDLLDVRVVNALIGAGLGLPTIRKAFIRASEVIENDHPFTTVRFQTDGRAIFLEIEADDDPILMDLLKGQYAFKRIVEPSLKNVEFSGGEAIRWWPLTQKRSIVLDPQISFGQPIVRRAGIPTSTLDQALKVEGSIHRVANIYKVNIEEIRDAVEFERSLAA